MSTAPPRWRRSTVEVTAVALIVGTILIASPFLDIKRDAELTAKMENECDLYGCHTVNVQKPAKKVAVSQQDKDILKQLSKFTQVLERAHIAGSTEAGKTQRLAKEMRKLEDEVSKDAAKLAKTHDLLRQEERKEEDERIARLKAQDQIKAQTKQLDEMSIEVQSEKDDERIALQDMDKDRNAIDSDGVVLAETKKELVEGKQDQLEEHKQLEDAQAALRLYQEHARHEGDIIALQNKIMHIQAHDIRTLEQSAKSAVSGVQKELGNKLDLRPQDQLKQDKWETKVEKMDDIRRRQLEAAHDWAKKREHPDMGELTTSQKAAENALESNRKRWTERSEKAAGKVASKFEKKESRMDDIRRRQLDAAHDWGKRREKIGDPSDAAVASDDKYKQKQSDWKRRHPEAASGPAGALSRQLVAGEMERYGSEKSRAGLGAQSATKEHTVAEVRSEEGGKRASTAKAQSGVKETKEKTVVRKKGVEIVEKQGKKKEKNGRQEGVSGELAAVKELLQRDGVKGAEGRQVKHALGAAEEELAKLSRAQEVLRNAKEHRKEQEEKGEGKVNVVKAVDEVSAGHVEAPKAKARAQALSEQVKQNHPQNDEFEVQVPLGAKGGEELQVHLPGGGLDSVELPSNVRAGTDVILVDSSDSETHLKVR